jgi:uncharacterized membrane protein YgcG
MLLNSAEKQHLDALVARAEHNTGTQIVAAIVPRSNGYPELPWLTFGCGALLGTLATVVLSIYRPAWEPNVLYWAAATFGGGAAGTMLCTFVPSLARQLLIILLVVMSVFIAVALNAPGPLSWFIAAFVGLFLLVFPVALFGRGTGGIIFIAYLILFPIAKLRGSRLLGQVRNRGWFDITGTGSWTDSSTSSWSSSDSGCSSSSDFSGGGGDSGGGGASGSW